MKKHHQVRTDKGIYFWEFTKKTNTPLIDIHTHTYINI